MGGDGGREGRKGHVPGLRRKRAETDDEVNPSASSELAFIMVMAVTAPKCLLFLASLCSCMPFPWRLCTAETERERERFLLPGAGSAGLLASQEP